MHYRWSATEDALLKKAFRLFLIQDLSSEQLGSLFPQRTLVALQKRAYVLGVRMPNGGVNIDVLQDLRKQGLSL